VPSERRRPSDAGYTTAEAAVALPALVLVSTMLLWAVLVGSAKVRCVDAAREAARAAARGDPAAAALGQAAAPSGASVSVSAAGDQVRAEVSAVSGGPGGLLSFRVSATAVAEREPGEPGAKP
jgi:hypothetical protein